MRKYLCAILIATFVFGGPRAAARADDPPVDEASAPTDTPPETPAASPDASAENSCVATSDWTTKDVSDVFQPTTSSTEDPVLSSDPAAVPSADPVSQDPVSQDPVSQDPVSQDPVSQDPVSQDPVAPAAPQPDATPGDGAANAPSSDGLTPSPADPVAQDPTPAPASADPVTIDPAAPAVTEPVALTPDPTQPPAATQNPDDPVTVAKAASPDQYTATDGDTLESIARKTNTSPDDIAQANKDAGSGFKAGQRVRLPSYTSSGPTQDGPSGQASGSGASAAPSSVSPDLSSDQRVQAMINMANQISAQNYPYKWGGGHDSGFTGPYDCSGSVSAVLHAAGLLDAPLVAAEFQSWGDEGPGDVTIYASPTHVYMSINGNFFGTSGSNPGGGANWFSGSARSGFVQRHVPLN